MRWLLCTVVLCAIYGEIGCPPVQPDIKPVEGMSPDDETPEDPAFGLEYERYLREVVMALEEDDEFRKKLETMNMTDIKNGKIAMHLELVSHQIREKLDELKRQEMDRLRQLAREKMKQMNAGGPGLQESDLHHVDVKNPHSFETADLEKLIKKATSDLDEIDKKRRGEFKQYEMEKEHLRREELAKLDEEHRKAREKELEEMKKKHQEHPNIHHPGSKAQLEDVWEKTDKLEPEDFNPKTFFKMHDLDGNGYLDQDEVEALFQKELDQVYDPNRPEDDMRERYEEMARMREHVFSEIDLDKDRLISQEEFMKYTKSNEFEKDEGWKTVDEQQNFTEEEYQRYEQMLREHEERMRSQGFNPNQPGMIPVGQDPNVQHMQIPLGGQGMHPQGQQFNQQQQQFNQQQQFQRQQQFQGGQGYPQGGPPGGFQGGAPPGHVPMQGGPPAMNQGQMGQMNMGQGQMNMGQGQMNMGQGQMNMGQGQMNMGQGPVPMGQGQVHMGQGQMQGQVPIGQAQVKAEVHGGQQPPVQGQGDQHGKPAENAQVQHLNTDNAAKPAENHQGENTNLNTDQGQGQNVVHDNSKIVLDNTNVGMHANVDVQKVDTNNLQGEKVAVPEGNQEKVVHEGQHEVGGQPPNQQVQGQQAAGQDTLKFQGHGGQQPMA
ncbi:nucleobindin-2-like isoform X2 [Dreissena polymorpha]|nr:nucleobindin-2-like isoform X2 [Dreissena polymorpha]